MGFVLSAKIVLSVGSFVLRHPKEVRRLPQWLRQRSLAPVEIRVPWWPYDATAWLSERLPPEARVFEYGGGGSTLWLHDRGAVITVVEHDPAWSEQLEHFLPSGTEILQRCTDAVGKLTSQVASGFFDSYVAAIDREPDNSIDLVIVDGRARVDCVRRAISKVRPGGLLLLDDSGRSRYQPAIAMLSGWEQHVFQGLKPGDSFPAQTSVWRRPGSAG